MNLKIKTELLTIKFLKGIKIMNWSILKKDYTQLIREISDGEIKDPGAILGWALFKSPSSKSLRSNEVPLEDAIQEAIKDLWFKSDFGIRKLAKNEICRIITASFNKLILAGNKKRRICWPISRVRENGFDNFPADSGLSRNVVEDAMNVLEANKNFIYARRFT